MVDWENFTCAACPLWKPHEGGIRGTCQAKVPQVYNIEGKIMVAQVDVDHSVRCGEGYEFLVRLTKVRQASSMN